MSPTTTGKPAGCPLRDSLIVLLCLLAPGWTAFGQGPTPLWPSEDAQEYPRIDGHRVVWHQFVAEYGDYDVVVADVNRLDAPRVQTLSLPGDQMYPDVWESRVVWQAFVADEVSGDWDIVGADLADWFNPWLFPVSGIIGNDEQFPAISGNTVVWQDGPAEHSDLYAADVTDPNGPSEFPVAAFPGRQQGPALDRTWVVWQDDFNGDWDIYVGDIWLRDRPTETLLTPFGGQQTAPAISGNTVIWQDDGAGDWDLYATVFSEQGVEPPFSVVATDGNQVNARIDGSRVVWQDDRFGHWDIFLADLETGASLRLTEAPSDQTLPDISGDLVVWQDDRSGVPAIFVLRLSE